MRPLEAAGSADVEGEEGALQCRADALTSRLAAPLLLAPPPSLPLLLLLPLHLPLPQHRSSPRRYPSCPAATGGVRRPHRAAPAERGQRRLAPLQETAA